MNEEGVCPVCGLWQSDAETDPEQRARINAAFAGVKSGQLADARREVERLRRDRDHLNRAQREAVAKLLADCRQAAFLFGALGHGGEHDRCDPCKFVRRYDGQG